MKKPNLRIIGIEEEDSQLKGPENIFNKIIEEKISSPKGRAYNVLKGNRH